MSRVIYRLGLGVFLTIAPSAQAQMVSGSDMKDFDVTFGLNRQSPATFAVRMVDSSVVGNILLPDEQPRFAFQIENLNGSALKTSGFVEVVAYGTKGQTGDIWTPQAFRVGSIARIPIQVEVGANGFQNLSIAPTIPAKFGAYALVVDLGDRGRQFLLPFVRTFAASTKRIQYPKFCLDELPLSTLKRLGVGAIRWGVSYKPTTDPDFPQWFAEQCKRLKEFQDANIAVLFMAGAGDFYHPNQPLRRPRPWLDSNGVMLDTKTDIAWTPDYDADFQKFTRLFATQYGWPRGPINAFSLWNEPWDGISISGWGADLLRYREIYRSMAKGVIEARQQGAQVLVGGTDSTSNAMDKLFGDEAGKHEFLPIFDFVSIHYQGLASGANIKEWRNRKGYGGRVKIWDTESWVANTDDRVATVVATNRASGYDRAMGIFGGNIAGDGRQTIKTETGTRNVQVPQAWSVAAAVGASQHFIGERDFRSMLFPNGLPWVMAFDGENGRVEDGTLVVVGDLGEAFGSTALHHSVRSFSELKHKAELRKQLAATPANQTKKRAEIRALIDKDEVMSGATMTLRVENDEFALFDSFGNRVPAKNHLITVPLDGRGFFLRGNGKRGSFARLIEATKRAYVSGFEPLETIAHDFTMPVGSKSSFKLTLTNVLNRPIQGTLGLKIGDLKVEAPRNLRFAAGETKTITVQATGNARPDNRYPLALKFDAGSAGIAVHEEELHANVIARKTPKIDGDLKDWQGVLPQTVSGSYGGPSLTEAAWFPFKNFDASTQNGLASGYLAYDKNNFYFAAKIADSTPDAGMVRTATRDDDSYFYPQTSTYKTTTQAFSARWSGQIEPAKSGKYTFSTLSDDGVRLWVNGQKLIDNWTPHGATEDFGGLELEAGKRYDIRLEYYQEAGEAAIKLMWQPPSEAKTVIPASSLYDQKGVAGALTGQLFRNMDAVGTPLVTRRDSQVDFNWGANNIPDPAFAGVSGTSLEWPAGVRRFSYRRDPDLPSGNTPAHDNVQIAFNVVPESKKPWLTQLPGLPAKFTTYWDTDYEYALNPIDKKYGGGTEIWRLQVPGMPHKHFYPRQPKWEGNTVHKEGPARGVMAAKRQGNTRIVEAAIPWSEIPDVKRCLDAGQNIKFSFRVNDNKGPSLELAKGRSVAKKNGSFHSDWIEHWANEIEFGWGK